MHGPARDELELVSQQVGAVATLPEQSVERAAVPRHGLGERRHVVLVVGLLERADHTDAGGARLAVEPQQLAGVTTAHHVLLLDLDVHHAVMLRHLTHTHTHTHQCCPW